MRCLGLAVGRMGVGEVCSLDIKDREVSSNSGVKKYIDIIVYGEGI